MGDEIGEDIEHLPLNVHKLTGPFQPEALEVEGERSEGIARVPNVPERRRNSPRVLHAHSKRAPTKCAHVAAVRPTRTSDVIVVGGGIVGLCSGLLLARDGHRVRLLERDPAAPPPLGVDPWDRWERRGVNQFQLLHGFLPRFRQLLDAELPDVNPALEAGGAYRFNRLRDLPDSLTGGWRRGDDRFESITGRRPMVEATLAHLVEQQSGVEVLRGAAVRGLLTGTPTQAGVPHV